MVDGAATRAATQQGDLSLLEVGHVQLGLGALVAPHEDGGAVDPEHVDHVQRA